MTGDAFVLVSYPKDDTDCKTEQATMAGKMGKCIAVMMGGEALSYVKVEAGAYYMAAAAASAFAMLATQFWSATDWCRQAFPNHLKVLPGDVSTHYMDSTGAVIDRASSVAVWFMWE